MVFCYFFFVFFLFFFLVFFLVFFGGERSEKEIRGKEKDLVKENKPGVEGAARIFSHLLRILSLFSRKWLRMAV